MTKITEAGKGAALRDTGAKWLERIKAAEADEKTFLDDAAAATAIYRAKGAPRSDGSSDAFDFNILFSNVETIVPAVINSAPAPDIRRRFGADDPAARDFAQLLERAISVQIDDSRLQNELEAMAQDGFLAGRGIVRLRFMSDFVGGETSDDALKAIAEAEGDNGADNAEDGAGDEAAGASGDGRVGDRAGGEQLANERIVFEAVSWRDYRHGKAKRWDQRPWEAFRHAIASDDYDRFVDGALVALQADENDDKEDADHEVWEVWDARSRTVLFIGAGDGKVLKKVADPLGLSGFFPTATPVQPIEVNGNLEPVNPFAIYRRLADELDTTTKRIRVITRQLKVKGWYGVSPTDVQAVLEADDNEFVPIADAEVWAKNGGLQGAVLFWPVERLIVVLSQLYGLRDQTKQAIYEITGISDIVRGASNAAETFGAQQIKSQWGSLRIHKMQRMIERASRDLFVMMAQVIPAKFSRETLQAMTDVQLLPSAQDLTPVLPRPLPEGLPPEAVAQAQQAALQEASQAEAARQKKLQHLAALNALMHERVTAGYRIDVETDSTVRADVSRKKQEATEFMSASSAFFASVGPLVQQGVMPADAAITIYGSFARLFNLGKAIEDVLDELIAKVRQGGGVPPAEADATSGAEKRRQEAAQLDQQIKLQNAEVERQIKRENASLDLQIKNAELQIKTSQLATVQRQLQMQQFGVTG
nr:MAG TPA: portal protein [Caudoviricetes sp.]